MFGAALLAPGKLLGFHKEPAEIVLSSRDVLDMLLPIPCWPPEELVEAISNDTCGQLGRDSYYRRIMPPLQITNKELNRSFSRTPPVVVEDEIEVDGRKYTSYSVPIETLPLKMFIRVPRGDQ
jgi:hypothetical protein